MLSCPPSLHFQPGPAAHSPRVLLPPRPAVGPQGPYRWNSGKVTSPISAAPRTIAGSGTFVVLRRIPRVATASAAVGISTMAWRPRITTAPVMAPTAAAVIPRTKAATAGPLPAPCTPAAVGAGTTTPAGKTTPTGRTAPRAPPPGGPQI